MLERFSDALSEFEPEPEAVTVESVKGKVHGRHEERRARTCALPFTEARDMSSRGSAQAIDELSSKATSESITHSQESAARAKESNNKGLPIVGEP